MQHGCDRSRVICFFFFSSRRRHTRSLCDWSSDVCSSDLDSANILTSARECFGRMCTWSNSTCFAVDGVCRSMRRSEEHTSELQSHSDLVCRLLLEKKKRSATTSLNHSRDAL